MALELERLRTGIDFDTRDLERGTRDVQRSLREMDRQASAFSRTFDRSLSGFGRSIGGMQQGIGRVEASLFNLRNAATAVAAGLAVRELQQYADGWTLAGDRVRLALRPHEDLDERMETLFDTAQDARVSFGALVDVYARVERSTRSIGLSTQELTAFTEGLAQTIRISGATAQEGGAALIQFGQGLASGRLQGEELRSVLEQLPRLADAIVTGFQEVAPELGVTRENLRELASEGRLTSEALARAFLSQLPRINREFEQTSLTIGDAATKVDNALGRLVGRSSDASGAASGIAQALSGLADVLSSEGFSQGIDTTVERFGRFFDVMGAGIGTVRDLGEALRDMAGFASETDFLDTISDNVARLGQRIEGEINQWRDAGIAIREALDIPLTDTQVERQFEAITEEIEATQTALEDLLSRGLTDAAAEQTADILTDKLQDLLVARQEVVDRLSEIEQAAAVVARVERGPAISTGALEAQSYPQPRATRAQAGALEEQAYPTPPPRQFPDPFEFLRDEDDALDLAATTRPQPERPERAAPPTAQVEEYLDTLREEVRIVQAANAERELTQALIRAENAAKQEGRALTEQERVAVEQMVAARQEAVASEQLGDLSSGIEEEIRLLETVEDQRDRIRTIIEAENIAKAAGRSLTEQELQALNALIDRREEARTELSARDRLFSEGPFPDAPQIDLVPTVDPVLDQQRAYRQLGEEIDNVIASNIASLGSFQSSWRDLDDVALSTLQSIAAGFIQTGVLQLIQGLGQSLVGLGGLGGGPLGGVTVSQTGSFTAPTPGLFSSNPIPFASGGSFSGGQVLRVGESGPETVFTFPDGSGFVVPYATSGSTPSLPFASGGTYGGMDPSKLKGLEATAQPIVLVPDLAKEIAKASQTATGGKGEVVVNVHDQRQGANSAPVEVESAAGPNGQQMIRIMVRDAFDQMVRTGEADPYFQRYGGRRVPNS